MSVKSANSRYIIWLMVLLFCIFFLIGHLVYCYLSDARRFPINTVKIIANYKNISRKELKSVLKKYLNESFILFPMRSLYVDLSTNVWADTIKIERIWPDILKITVVEKVAFAIWNDSMFISEDGKLFPKSKDQIDEILVHLVGPENQYKEVLQIYKKISKILEKEGLYLNVLVLRENQALDLTLTNGILVRLGKQDFKMRLNRFCKAYSSAFAVNANKLISVDLRYPRGMAVEWKQYTTK